MPGDFILVYKTAYGNYGTFGLRYATSVTPRRPSRGDIMVFLFPGDPNVFYAKRVVGLPGDELSIRGRDLVINGRHVAHKYLGEFTYKSFNGETLHYEHYHESLGASTHEILILNQNQTTRREYYIVPDGHYFVMGDNRDMSNDSRYWGFLPEDNLIGKAVYIWFSFGPDGRIRWERLGSLSRG